MAPKLPFIFDMAVANPFYLTVIRHLVEGDTGVWPRHAAAAQENVARTQIALFQLTVFK